MLVASATACTGIRLTAADGTVVQARTMEFGVDMDSNVIVVPRGYERTGTTPDGKPGLKWSSKYACVGANGVGLPIMVDGLNEKGLAAGLFYFPGTATTCRTPPPTPTRRSRRGSSARGSWRILRRSTKSSRLSTKIVVPEVRAQAMGLLSRRALRRDRRDRCGDRPRVCRTANCTCTTIRWA